MQRLILILFIACELCYYLLIAQTGVVEYFSSNLFFPALLLEKHRTPPIAVPY